jgi:HEAT repeat protein
MNRWLALLAGCCLLAAAARGPAQLVRAQKDVENAVRTLKTDKDAKNRVEALARIAEVAQVRIAFIKPAMPALIEAMADPAAEVRRAAANVLGLANQEHDKVVPVLIKALDKKEDRTVRIACANALNAFGGNATDAITVLAEIQKELNGMPQDARDNELLQATSQALGTIQAAFKEQADRIIAQLRADPDAETRIKAIETVAKLAKSYPAYAGPAYAAIVDAWIKDRDADVRKAVQDWVRTAKPEPRTIVTPLLQILNNPQEEKFNRVAAATMLAGLRGDAKEALPALNELKGKEQDQDVLSAVGFALRRIQAAVDEKQ